MECLHWALIGSTVLKGDLPLVDLVLLILSAYFFTGFSVLLDVQQYNVFFLLKEKQRRLEQERREIGERLAQEREEEEKRLAQEQLQLEAEELEVSIFTYLLIGCRKFLGERMMVRFLWKVHLLYWA